LTKNIFCLLALFLTIPILQAQKLHISGQVTYDNKPLEFVKVSIPKFSVITYTDSLGQFSVYTPDSRDTLSLIFSALGYQPQTVTIISRADTLPKVNINLSPLMLEETVITGNLRSSTRSESPIPIEVYGRAFFKTLPAPSMFESFQQINGVRPQVNCNICNTGDIHINGLEGPYTLVLIDGMPIVSGLSTVYGLSGIPSALIEQIEIVKGPASSLYGAEAVGGLINVITRSPDQSPKVSLEMYSSDWGDVNTDVGFKFKVGKKINSLWGINYFNYSFPKDNNHDGFTDITLQNRISVFNKWNFERKNKRVFSIATRYLYENRWGGQMNWTSAFRGGDSIYGESIYTRRGEIIGQWQLPVNPKIVTQFSFNRHEQNSVYGIIPFIAFQETGFGQLVYYSKPHKPHQLLIGSAIRYTRYDDNTPATEYITTTSEKRNTPTLTVLPGLFIQEEYKWKNKHTILTGVRYDYHPIHGSVYSPRLNYKWNNHNKNKMVRIGIGNGYRVAQIFTEDHAALTGARKVIFEEKLKPETSWNINMNYVQNIFTKKGMYLNFEATLFHTYFTNRIIPDYLSNPNEIRYRNLLGYSISKGITLNTKLVLPEGIQLQLGLTRMDVTVSENGNTRRQLLTEKISGTWIVSYTLSKINLTLDYTGNIYGPMLLPLLGPLDQRAAKSPVYSIQNIQISKGIFSRGEIFGGIKNLLNFTPPANSIARSFDPFDKQVKFDSQGHAIATTENPQALTFDPTYVFAPNQGIRLFLGFRWKLE
jgi:outer membrane receptor for ferrienterochelin and colicins